MSDIDRRTLLRLIAAAPMAAGFVWTEAQAQEAHQHAHAAELSARQAGTPFTPQFFTEHEYATVRVLVDLIIPRDDRSGSATEAGVPEFMDFMMADQPALRTPMRGGLAWLDLECQKRFDKTFLAASAAERAAVLDDISWSPSPTRSTRPELSQGVAFFASFRDLTASGFWTSEIGIADLQYMGNTFVAEWTGCPDEVLKKIGVGAPGNRHD